MLKIIFFTQCVWKYDFNVYICCIQNGLQFDLNIVCSVLILLN